MVRVLVFLVLMLLPSMAQESFQDTTILGTFDALERDLTQAQTDLELLSTFEQYLVLLENQLQSFEASPTTSVYLHEVQRSLDDLGQLVVNPARVAAFETNAKQFLSALRAERSRLSDLREEAEGALLASNLPGWFGAKRFFDRALNQILSRFDIELDALDAEGQAVLRLLNSRGDGGNLSEAAAASLAAFAPWLEGVAGSITTLRESMLGEVRDELDAVSLQQTELRQHLTDLQGERQTLLERLATRQRALEVSNVQLTQESRDAPSTYGILLVLLGLSLFILLVPRFYPLPVQQAFITSGTLSELVIVLLLFGSLVSLGLRNRLSYLFLGGLLAALLVYLFLRPVLQRARHYDSASEMRLTGRNNEPLIRTVAEAKLVQRKLGELLDSQEARSEDSS